MRILLVFAAAILLLVFGIEWHETSMIVIGAFLILILIRSGR